MKRIIIATAEPENEIIKLASFMLKGMNLKVSTADFNDLYADFADTDVLLCNYSLCDEKNLSFAVRNRADGVFVMDCPMKDNLISVWAGTPHLRVAQNTDKLLKLLANTALDGGYEIERKFLIKYPDIEYLSSLSNCRAVNMEQVYLKRGPAGESMRVRKSWEQGSIVFVKTEKQKISDTVRIEREYEISAKEYEIELENRDITLNTISKTRYCLMYNDVYYEIDVFPFWKKQAYLEVELSSENEKVEIPPFLKVIREVTEDRRYTNHSLAGNVPNED